MMTPIPACAATSSAAMTAVHATRRATLAPLMI